MYTVLFLYTAFTLFLNRYRCETNSPPLSTLCPKGYWAAEVDDGTAADGAFSPYYMNKGGHKICQFCPQIGCYVVQRHTVGDKDGSTEPTTALTADASTMHNIKRNTISTGIVPEHMNKTARNKTGKRQLSQTTQLKTYMSCSDWENLPKPEDIVSYLDCVIIGKTDAYFLFIYEPRFQAQRVPVIDCVDAGFLDWIPNGTQLLGLELGFRMKHIPPYLFRYNQRIMEALPTTSDRVDQTKAIQLCPFRVEANKKEARRRKQRTGLFQELHVPPSFLSACLLLVVLLLTIGIIIAFCVINAERLMLFKTRGRKRREREAALALEMAEQAAKQAAAAAAAEAQARHHNAWHPISGRYGMGHPGMGGAFGAFSVRHLNALSSHPSHHTGTTAT
ncbi:hypothetical protein CRM22_007054 [Opisthorchis felineus]|uniref:Uncharacterized protein n=1 Tax=Opisthorchis felineus TaxID=147828 RepID=A0A4V3SE46_OPIFE|nr:hypothetical protein CRM22_007054 [Opisthorchis felineus]